jgi:hypothetical protein
MDIEIPFEPVDVIVSQHGVPDMPELYRYLSEPETYVQPAL